MILSSWAHSPSRAASLASCSRSPRVLWKPAETSFSASSSMSSRRWAGRRPARSGKTWSMRVVTSRTQFGPPCRRRPQILLTPSIVDNQKNATIAERLAEPGRGGRDGLQSGPFARQEHYEVGNGRDQPLRLLAKLRPQDAVEKGVLNVGVVRQRLCERGLAIAAGTFQRRSNPGDRIALGVEELLFERIELLRPRHEIRRRLGRHYWHALLPAVGFEHADQRGLVLNEIEVVDLAEPARQLAEVA